VDRAWFGPPCLDQGNEGIVQSPSSRNHDLLVRLYDAARHSDWATILPMWDDNVVLHEMPGLPYGGTFEGIASAGEVMANLGAGLDMSTLVVEYILADEERAVAMIRVGLHGGLGEIRVSEHWKFRNGKAVEVRPFYWDPEAVTEAVASTKLRETTERGR